MHRNLLDVSKFFSDNRLEDSRFRMIRSFKLTLLSGLLACSQILCSGCGESNSNTAASPNNPASAPTPNQDKTTPKIASQQPEVANESASFEALNGSSSAAVPLNTESAAPVSSPKAAATIPPAAVKSVAKVQPTASQLSAWKSVPYDQLQLLKLIDSKEAGLLSRIVALPDGKSYILAGTKLTLWSIDQNDAPIHTFIDLTKVENNSIKSMDVSSDGRLLVACDSTGTVKVYDIQQKKELASQQLSKAALAEIALSPNSDELASVGFNGDIGIWKIEDLSPKNQFKVDTNGVKQIEYVSNGVLAIAGQESSTWNTTTGQKVTQLSPGRYHAALALSPDGSSFMFADEGGIKIVKASDLSQEGVLQGNFSMDERVRIEPQGSLVATINGTMMRVWDRASNKLVQVIDDAGGLLVDATWAPKSNLLISASVDGRVLLWGSTSNGDLLGLKPLHHSAVAAANAPASSELLLQTIDLRVFPRYPQSQSLLENETSLSYTTSASKEDLETFCRYQMQERDWTEIAGPAPMPGMMTFQKNGSLVSVVVTDMTASERNVSMTLLGNYDLRKAPRPNNINPETVFENENTVMFKSSAILPVIETELLKAMHAAGWTAYARLNASKNEQPDARDLEFINGGVTLRVMIGKFPTDPSKYTIQYSRFVSLHALPIPVDSGFVEFDGSVSPFLVANTHSNLQDTVAFYDKQMSDNGWLVRNRDRHIDEKICWLPYTRGAESVGISLKLLPEGKTQIRVGQKLENTSWQIEKRKDANESVKQPEGIEAADIPVPSGAENVKYDMDNKSIEFDIATSSLADITDGFKKAITSLGWTTDDSGVRSDEYVLATYEKNKAEIQWRARMQQGKAVVSIQGDALLWTKAAPGTGGVISYETWQRRNNRLAGLEGLDQYLKEMKAAEASGK
jgi:WD40 repeat protein